MHESWLKIGNTHNQSVSIMFTYVIQNIFNSNRTQKVCLVLTLIYGFENLIL